MTAARSNGYGPHGDFSRDLDARTMAMADAVCDLSDGLSRDEWHDCLDDLVVILAAYRSGAASR